MNQIEESLKEHLAPALESFAAKLSDPKVIATIDELIGGIGKLADYFIKNPLAGIGQIIAMAVTKDIASAAIGQGIKAILMGLLGGGGGIGGKVGALGTIGTGGAIAGAAVATTVAGMAAIDMYAANERDSSSRSVMSGVQGSMDAAALTRKAKTGTVTAEDLTKAQASADAQASVVAEKEAALKGGPGFISKLTGVSNEVAADQKAQYLLQKSALDDMIKAITATTEALGRMKTTVPPQVPPVTAGQPSQPNGSNARAG